MGRMKAYSEAVFRIQTLQDVKGYVEVMQGLVQCPRTTFWGVKETCIFSNPDRPWLGIIRLFQPQDKTLVMINA